MACGDVLLKNRDQTESFISLDNRDATSGSLGSIHVIRRLKEFRSLNLKKNTALGKKKDKVTLWRENVNIKNINEQSLILEIKLDKHGGIL